MMISNAPVNNSTLKLSHVTIMGLNEFWDVLEEVSSLIEVILELVGFSSNNIPINLITIVFKVLKNCGELQNFQLLAEPLEGVAFHSFS
jgi:hypothetical protein